MSDPTLLDDMTLDFVGTPIQGPQGEQGPKGDDGTNGTDGRDGVDGTNGTNGSNGLDGKTGAPGLSAYQLWLNQGNQGTVQDYLNSNKGAAGADGQSSYELWLAQGNTGSEAAFMASLKGANGDAGLSAYAIWVQNGGVGTEADYLASLKGAKGDKGDAGTNGSAGTNGADGLSAYQEAVNLGFVGSESAWLASLKGEKGDQGIQGEKGDAGTGLTNRGNWVTGTVYHPSDYVFAVNSTGNTSMWIASGDEDYTSNTQPKDDTAHWIEFQAPAGADGKSVELQKTSTAIQWRVVGGTWADLVQLSAITGPAGAAGANGNTVLTTTGAPAAGTGANGDYAFDISAQIMYGPKAAGAWPAGVSLKGVKGDTGNTGTAGTNGTNGATWLATSGAPANTTGNNGDWAIDQAAAIVYGPKAAGVWPAGTSIKGAKGDTGNTGLTGAAGSVWQSAAGAPLNTLGANGDYYLNTSTGDVYGPKTGGVWGAILMNLKGPKGDTGAAGSGGTGGGTTWLIGTSDPTGTTGADGNMYLNTSSTVVWSRSAGTWTAVGAMPPIATTAQAQAATSNLVLMTPAHTREYLDQFGFGSTYLNTVADCNTAGANGQFFAYSNTTANSPVASTYGRGINIAGGGNYSTQIAIQNDTGAMFVRYETNGTWAAWIAIGGTAMVGSGTGHKGGLVPDPGATAGTTKFLREDGTWAVPAGGSGGGSAATLCVIQPADVSINTSGYTALGMKGTNLPVIGQLYRVSGMINVQGDSAGTIGIHFTGGTEGADIVRLTARAGQGSTTMIASSTTQDSVDMVGGMSGVQDSTMSIDGMMRFTYVGTTGPDLTVKLLTGTWGSILKNSFLTFTPIS